MKEGREGGCAGRRRARVLASGYPYHRVLERAKPISIYLINKKVLVDLLPQ